MIRITVVFMVAGFGAVSDVNAELFDVKAGERAAVVLARYCSTILFSLK